MDDGPATANGSIQTLAELCEVEQAHARIAPNEVVQGSEVSEINDDFVVIRIGAMKREGKVAVGLQRRPVAHCRMVLRHDAATNKFAKAAFRERINKRLAIDIWGGVLLLWASQIMVGCLAQVAKIFAEDRILDLDIRQVMKPRSGQVLEVIIRLQEPKHFDVTVIYLIRINDAGRADRFVAGAMSSCWSTHAPEYMLATTI